MFQFDVYAGILSGAKVVIANEQNRRKIGIILTLHLICPLLANSEDALRFFFLHFWNGKNQRAVTD
jgi:hypothetical protein